MLGERLAGKPLFFFRVPKWLKPEIGFGWLVINRVDFEKGAGKEILPRLRVLQ